MKFAYDIPGYVQGHRFADHPDYYDADQKYFRDLAGGDRFGQGVSHVLGTPQFATRGARSQRGLFLDNTNHWQFPHACPWMGSGLIVAEFSYVTTATTIFFPWVFGEATFITTNALIYAQAASGQRRLVVTGGSNQFPQSFSDTPNNAITIFAWSRNQQDRKSRITRDGVAITESAAYNTGNNHGGFVALGGQPRVRLGNLNGTAGDTTPSTTGTLHVFEQHFWKGDVLRDHPGKLAEFIASLSGVYGIE